MLNSFTRRFVVVLVFAFSCFSLGANANEDLVVKPKPNPVIENVTKLYTEREIISSKIFSWEMQGAISREFAELMVENPGTLDGEERVVYYNSLLDKIDFVFFEIDKALSNESGAESFQRLSIRLTLFSVMTKALLYGAQIMEVEDILKDSEALNPRFPSLAKVIKNQSLNLCKFLESYEQRSSLNRPQFYRAIQYQTNHSNYEQAVFLETKFMDFAKEQMLANNKLLEIMLKNLYIIEPGSEKEFFFHDVLLRRYRLQDSFYSSRYPDFKTKLKIYGLDLLLIRFLNDPEQNIISEEDLSNNPFQRVLISRANAINHVEIYTNLGSRFESEHYRLLKLTSEFPEAKESKDSETKVEIKAK